MALWSRRRNEPQLSLSLAAIGELLDVLNGFNLEPADVYFLGFSQGACLLLEYCARHARKYGGIIAFTGGSIGQEPDLSQYEGSFEGPPSSSEQVTMTRTYPKAASTRRRSF
jgi:phospholipase/carboxylesterase